MSLDKAAILTAILTSIAFTHSVFAQDIDGNCNVVSPGGGVLGSVTYEINCTNISREANEQLKRILEIIEASSQSESDGNFERALEVLARNSQAGLEELRRAKSPNLVLSRGDFRACDSCYTDVDFVNVGGNILRVDEVSVRELVVARLDSHNVLTGQGEVACPFREFGPFESRHIIMDYSDAGFSYSRGENIGEGSTIATIEFSGRHRNQKAFEKAALENYNRQREIRLGTTVDSSILRACTDFDFTLGVRFSLLNYSGAKYEQFFLLKYKSWGSEIELVDARLGHGAAAFNEHLERYTVAEQSRKNANGSEMVSWGAIAKFMMDNTRQ